MVTMQVGDQPLVLLHGWSLLLSSILLRCYPSKQVAAHAEHCSSLLLTRLLIGPDGSGLSGLEEYPEQPNDE